MILPLVVGLFILGVLVVIAIDIHERSHYARRVDGTPVSYDEFDRSVRDFDRQRERQYKIPQDADDEHGRIRDEIRRTRPRPRLTAAVGLVLIALVAVLMLALYAINTDPAIAASAAGFTLPDWVVWGMLGMSLVVGLFIGAVGCAVGMSPAYTILCGIVLAGLFYLATMPGMAGTGVVAVFASAVGAAFAVMAGAMLPATIILAVFR